MNNGSDLALTVADVVFMNTEPESIFKAKKIVDTIQFISYENIFLTLIIKGIILLLEHIGHPNIRLAIFADSGASVLFILNSIRLMNKRKYR